MKNDDKKLEILAQYEREASEKNSSEWFASGGSVRVPEGKAAHYFIERKVDEALKLVDMDIGRNADVLEIGCSFGHMTFLLAERFDSLIAVDLSPTSVDIASSRLEKYGVDNVRFFVDDAEQLRNVEDGSCDVIFSFSTIRFCPDQEKALRAVHSKLRGNAVAIIDFPNPNSPWHLFIKAVSGIEKHVNDTLMSKQELVEMFNRCGFEVERVKTFLFTTKRLPSYLLPIFKMVDLVFERIPLVRDLGGIVVFKARRR